MVQKTNQGKRERRSYCRPQMERVENVDLVRCVSDFAKDTTCHRQSSSGNICPGGEYVNKQAQTHTHKTKQGAKETPGNLLTHRCASLSVNRTIHPNVANRINTSSNTHRRMKTHSYIYISHNHGYIEKYT